MARRRLLPLASLLLLAACSPRSATPAPPQHAGKAATPAVAPTDPPPPAPPPSRLAAPHSFTAVDGLPAALAAEHPRWEVVHGRYLEYGVAAIRLYPDRSW